MYFLKLGFSEIRLPNIRSTRGRAESRSEGFDHRLESEGWARSPHAPEQVSRDPEKTLKRFDRSFHLGHPLDEPSQEASTLLKHLARSGRKASTSALSSLDFTLTSRLYLAIIQPYLMVPSVVSEAREPQVTRFPKSSMLMSGSRAAPHPNWGESLVIRVGVLLV
jgi:hypothetical protein